MVTILPRAWSLPALLGLHLACAAPAGPPPLERPSPSDAAPPVDRPPGEPVPSPPSPLRRLTRAEYDHTVRDLLGDTRALARHFPPDEESGGFHNNAATLGVSELHAERYLAAAEALAAAAVTRLPALLPCDPAQTGETPCALRFIETFGLRAYRRPLAPAESSSLAALYHATRQDEPFPTAVETVLAAMLQSPHFLYRVEGALAPPGERGAVRLTPFELASRLSYLLWASMPDDTLLAAAATGALDTPDALERQARRMLADPRARDALADFYLQWLDLTELGHLTKDNPPYPLFTNAMRASMVASARAFIDYVLWDADARLDTLLTSPVAFVDAPLAALYRVPAPASGALTRMVLDPAERAGVLTLPGVLALQARLNASSPVRRGHLVRARLLCQPLPDPPADVVIVAPDPRPGTTNRQRYAEHAANAACAGCHRMMDPLGFALEHFDGIGQYHATEGGRPVDASGELRNGGTTDGPVRGASELARRLAASEVVRDCVAAQWFRYAFGRGETDADERSLEQVQTAFAASRYDLRELVVAITRTDAFRYRRGSASGEETP